MRNYFGYKESFDPDAIWVPTPEILTWINITDLVSLENQEAESQHDAVPGYQQMATHTLEALSTAATRESPQFASSYPANSYGYSTPYVSNQVAYAPNIDPDLERADPVSSLLSKLSEDVAQ